VINLNGSYFQNPTFPTATNDTTPITPPGNTNYYDTMPMEQSYIENILRLNKGKKVKAYVSYPDSSAWQNKVYEGTIEEAGRDHLIITDPSTGTWYLIRMIYLDYVEFDEKINYSHIYSEKTF
jgi:spore germination protein Q